MAKLLEIGIHSLAISTGKERAKSKKLTWVTDWLDLQIEWACPAQRPSKFNGEIDFKFLVLVIIHFHIDSRIILI